MENRESDGQHPSILYSLFSILYSRVRVGGAKPGGLNNQI